MNLKQKAELLAELSKFRDACTDVSTEDGRAISLALCHILDNIRILTEVLIDIRDIQAAKYHDEREARLRR